MRQIDEQSRIEQDIDGASIRRDRRDVAQGTILLLPLGPQPRLLGIGRLDIRARPDLTIASHTISDDGVTGFDERGGAFSTLPTAGIPSARAMIATWLAGPPSSSTIPRSLARS